MMAPHFERARVIAEAVNQANYLLNGELIDLVRIDGGNITVAAGPLMVTGTYQHNSSYSEDGSPILGGGHWQVIFGEVQKSPGRTWLERLAGKR